MRDPKRINRILSLIRNYWHKYPDMRLTQIIYNADPKELGFNLEDSDLETELEKLKDR